MAVRGPDYCISNDTTPLSQTYITILVVTSINGVVLNVESSRA